MNKNYSPSELLEVCRVKNLSDPGGEISIGCALDHLNRLGRVPNEFQGDASGLDALCYHLDKVTVCQSIDTLKAILRHWEQQNDGTSNT